MKNGRSTLVAIISLAVGFGGGFLLRPAILPVEPGVAITRSEAGPASDARGTQYFVAHIDEARRVVAGCRDGSVRGGECATAEEAIIKVDAQERRRRFLGN